MGTGYVLSCRRCGYKQEAWLGAGFCFPVAYQKIMETARSGRLGEELRTFLAEHPEGALNTSTVLLKCGRCGVLKTAPSLSMYLPKRPEAQPAEGNRSAAFSGEGFPCVAPWELKENYTLSARYHYRCHKCGSEMKSYSSKALERLFSKYGMQEPVEELCCPDCEKALYFTDVLKWD